MPSSFRYYKKIEGIIIRDKRRKKNSSKLRDLMREWFDDAVSILILIPIVFVIVNGNLIMTLYDRNHLSLFNPLFSSSQATSVYRYLRVDVPRFSPFFILRSSSFICVTPVFLFRVRLFVLNINPAFRFRTATGVGEGRRTRFFFPLFPEVGSRCVTIHRLYSEETSSANAHLSKMIYDERDTRSMSSF